MDRAGLVKLYYYHISETAPKEALRNVKYVGELREKRLKKFGLEREMKYASGTGVINGQQISRCEDDRYVSEMYAYDGILTEAIRREDKVIHKDVQERICYGTVTDIKGGQPYEEEIYCCPNCGAPSKVDELEKGCPYCGTHFEMAQLFPTISNAFTVKDFSEAGKKHTSARPFVIAGFLLGIVFAAYIVVRDGMEFDSIAGAILDIPLGAFLGYFVWAILKLGSVIREGASSTSMLGAIGSNKKFEKIMSQYSPEYTYEYFTGIVFSMIQTLIFSEKDDELPFYLGKENHLFEDVVSSSFRGAMKLENCSVQSEICSVRVKVFLDNLHYDGKKIHQKNETITVGLKKDLKGRVNNPFSMHAINCRNCGGIFDAYMNHICPFCGSAYELQDVDWIITDFTA